MGNSKSCHELQKECDLGNEDSCQALHVQCQCFLANQSKNVVEEVHSTGFHILELHNNSAGVGVLYFLAILGLLAVVMLIYLKCKTRTWRPRGWKKERSTGQLEEQCGSSSWAYTPNFPRLPYREMPRVEYQPARIHEMIQMGQIPDIRVTAQPNSPRLVEIQENRTQQLIQQPIQQPNQIQQKEEDPLQKEI